MLETISRRRDNKQNKHQTKSIRGRTEGCEAGRHVFIKAAFWRKVCTSSLLLALGVAVTAAYDVDVVFVVLVLLIMTAPPLLMLNMVESCLVCALERIRFFQEKICCF